MRALLAFTPFALDGNEISRQHRDASADAGFLTIRIEQKNRKSFSLSSEFQNIPQKRLIRF